MKNIKAPKLVTIAVLTLITVVFGVGFEVYRTFTQKPAIPVPQNVINPINPTLDQTALSKLQERMYLEEGQIGQTLVASPTPTIEPTIAPTATPEASASGSPLPSATPAEIDALEGDSQ